MKIVIMVMLIIRRIKPVYFILYVKKKLEYSILHFHIYYYYYYLQYLQSLPLLFSVRGAVNALKPSSTLGQGAKKGK